MQQQGTVFVGNYSFNQSDVLGKGVTGNVYKGKRHTDNYPVAIKAIDLKLNQNQVTLSLLQTQLKTLKLIKPHPNLITTLDILKQQNFCFIVTELYSGGTLKQLLEKQGILNQQLALRIFHKIVSGYCAISDASIIHRDLKPANIMLKENSLEPVIIDFGFAEIIQTKTVMKAFNVGSPAYMSPEAFTKTLYSEKSDVWALGVILYEMLTGQTFDEGIETKTYFNLLSDSFITQKISLFAEIFKQILSQVLRMNAFERISVHKIKYILDKHMIMKINNPIKTLHSPIQFIPSITALKSQPLLMNKSNSFDDQNKKQGKSIFQSGHFDMRTSVHNNSIGFSNLTISTGNCLIAKKTESRYQANMISPVRNDQRNQIIQVNRSIEKANQFQLRNKRYQQNNTPNVPIQPLQNSMQINYQNKVLTFNQQSLKLQENSKIQTEYFTLKSREVNLIKPVPQKQYFYQPQTFIKSNNQLTVDQVKDKNIREPLSFKQTSTEDKKIMKQKSPNHQKFSFKKMTQNQEFYRNQYFSHHQQAGGKQNTNLRDHMVQSVTQLNFNHNIYSSVHPNSKVMVRNQFNQSSSNQNIQPQLTSIRRIF